ncbi:hypothetical protein F2P56_002389 [Juglans regia]|uniref:Uncharacterized protein n=2 Tax=Juglans regia TaxID=51240 RepID=A0A834DAZ8_JUGRE|nr:transcription factor MYB1-like [Juglans regia]KAF5481761.1 hypothetical protein F2P56_002389 [Juglans regia]
MGRRPCCTKEGLNRGAWSAREDNILINYVKAHGEGKWRDVPERAGLKRCGKSCRLRWLNYLRPDIKRGNISVEEEELIIRLHKLLGNRWSLIAGRIPGRTDNEIKNYWNTHLSRRIMQDGYKILQDSYNKQLITDDDEGSRSEFIQGTGQETHDDHSVVRTKEMRCSNAFIPKQLDIEMEKNASTLVIPDWGSDQIRSSLAQQEDNSDENFLMDYVVNDLLMSDHKLSCLDSHQDKELNECENMVDGEMDHHAKNNYIMPSCCEDFLVSGHDQAMRENWRPQTEPNSQPNDALDLKTLTSLLNLEDEWIIS